MDAAAIVGGISASGKRWWREGASSMKEVDLLSERFHSSGV